MRRKWNDLTNNKTIRNSDSGSSALPSDQA